MRKTTYIGAGIFLAIALFFCCSCQKKGDFINEGLLGSGIHYYPTILNKDYYDTLTQKYLNKKDTLFSEGQKIIFEIKYASQDSIDRIEVWSAETGKQQQKLWSTPFRPDYYSAYQKNDTTFAMVELPVLKDTSLHELSLYPKIITKRGLIRQRSFKIRMK